MGAFVLMAMRKMMGLQLLCALVLTLSLSQGSEEPPASDEWLEDPPASDKWTEDSSKFVNGWFSDSVEGYTCGMIQKGACSPRGGSCKRGWTGEYCKCRDGYHKSK